MAAATQKNVEGHWGGFADFGAPQRGFLQGGRQPGFDFLTSGITSYDPYGVMYFKYTYGSDSQVNKSGTGTPELDEQIAELEKLPTQEEQIQKANELEKEALKQYGIMPYAKWAAACGVEEDAR